MTGDSPTPHPLTIDLLSCQLCLFQARSLWRTSQRRLAHPETLTYSTSLLMNINQIISRNKWSLHCIWTFVRFQALIWCMLANCSLFSWYTHHQLPTLHITSQLVLLAIYMTSYIVLRQQPIIPTVKHGNLWVVMDIHIPTINHYRYSRSIVVNKTQ